MSRINVDNIQTSLDGNSVNFTQSLSKVNAKFNMDTNTIDHSYNVSSLTDNSTGQFTLSLTNNYNDVNAACAGMAHDTAVSFMFSPTISHSSTSSQEFGTSNPTPAFTDGSLCGTTSFGQLA